MNISEVKTYANCFEYCNTKNPDCDGCPIKNDCINAFDSFSTIGHDFYNAKLSLIIAYNRKEKLAKLLS